MDYEIRLQCLGMAVKIGGNAQEVLRNAEAFRQFVTAVTGLDHLEGGVVEIFGTGQRQDQ